MGHHGELRVRGGPTTAYEYHTFQVENTENGGRIESLPFLPADRYISPLARTLRKYEVADWSDHWYFVRIPLLLLADDGEERVVVDQQAVAGLLNIEDLSLASINPGRYRLIALPLRMEGAEASPARVLVSTTIGRS